MLLSVDLRARLWSHDAKYFGTMGQCTVHTGWWAYHHPLLHNRYDPNHAGYLRLAAADVTAVLERIEATYSAAGMDAVVYLDVDATPPTLAATLVARGYTPMVHWGTVNLLVAPAATGTTPAQRVTRVSDDRGREQWARLQDADPYSDADTMYRLRRAEIADPRVDAWLVWDGAEPVGRCLTYIADGLGRIESVFVAPHARRRGMAAALVTATAQHIASHGALPYLFAIAGEDAHRVYERLGFVVAVPAAVLTYVRDMRAS